MYSYRTLLGGLACVLFAGCGGSDAPPVETAGASSSAGAGGTGGETVDFTSGSGAGESSGGPDGSCASDADCDDADACTTDTCVAGGDAEVSLGQCEHEPSSAGSECGDLPPPVESCAPGCADPASAVFPPAISLAASKLPASCASGFEMNRPAKEVFTIEAPGGSAARTLEVEIATYTAPDHIRISGIDQNGAEYTLVENCSMRTATYADPTGDGCSRPPDETIRQYAVELKAGTKSLTFDMTGACTPTYLRVLGLCDFDVAPFFSGCRFRLIP